MVSGSNKKKDKAQASREWASIRTRHPSHCRPPTPVRGSSRAHGKITETWSQQEKCHLGCRSQDAKYRLSSIRIARAARGHHVSPHRLPECCGSVCFSRIADHQQQHPCCGCWQVQHPTCMVLPTPSSFQGAQAIPTLHPGGIEWNSKINFNYDLRQIRVFSSRVGITHLLVGFDSSIVQLQDQYAAANSHDRMPTSSLSPRGTCRQSDSNQLTTLRKVRPPGIGICAAAPRRGTGQGGFRQEEEQLLPTLDMLEGSSHQYARLPRNAVIVIDLSSSHEFRHVVDRNSEDSTIRCPRMLVLSTPRTAPSTRKVRTFPAYASQV